MSGLFVTLEGGEGAGKSTQIKRLYEYFSAIGRAVIMTREPGGTAPAEEIRNLLVNGDPGKWSSTSEALLNSAARHSHLQNLVRPALAAGNVVLCDRFMDSTRAYQAVAGDCPVALVDALEQAVVGSTRPHLTLIFDLDPINGLARAKQRSAGQEDRFERKGMSYHQTLRQAFLDIAANDPARCAVINAEAPIETVWQNIVRTLQERGIG
jgi:dTMP kinase